MTVLVDQLVSNNQQIDVTVPSPSQAAYLVVTNDSQYELEIFYDGMETSARFLSAYTEVLNERPIGTALGVRPSNGWLGRITLKTSLPSGVVEDPNPPASLIRVEGFATQLNGERRTVRQVAQGTVLVGTAQQLEGQNQAQALTTLDASGGPELIPASGNNTPLTLAARDGSGNPLPLATLDPVAQAIKFFRGLILNIFNGGLELGQQGASNTPFIDFHSGATATDYDARLMGSGGNGTAGNGVLAVIAGQLQLSAQITQVANQGTAGPLGVPAITTLIQDFFVSDTVAHTLLNFTTPNINQVFRVSAHVSINNTAAQAVTLGINYTPLGNAAQTRDIPLIAASGEVYPNGVPTIGTGGYPGESLTLSVAANSAFSIVYRDPGGSPQDRVTLVIERLA